METQARGRQVHRTKAELITHELRTQIFAGHLAPGQRLILREIAEDFGSSEIPVREALNSLASLGLVTMIPYEGARVAKLNLTELIELTEVRLLLEKEATLQAVRDFPPEALATLKEIIQRMERANVDKNTLAYGELNRELHDAIISHCPNVKMIAFIRDLRNKTERSRAVHSRLPSHTSRSLKIHKSIVRAIASGKHDQLATLLDEHNGYTLIALKALPEEVDAPAIRIRRT